MSERIWILGASDPEMELIEQLLRECGEAFVYATDERGERVRGGTAYKAHAAIPSGVRRAYLVECDASTPEGVDRVVVDHHREGNSGYGKSPERFFEASSVGQAIVALAKLGITPPFACSCDEEDDPELKGTDLGIVRAVQYSVGPDRHFVCGMIRERKGWFCVDEHVAAVAAADHCLAAAYRGECPGADPDKVMAWRAVSRARFQKRSVDEVLADIGHARDVLREAPEIALAATPGGHCGDGSRCGCRDGGYGYGGSTAYGTGDCYCDCEGCERGDEYITARDMRGRHVPELPEASAREGLCFIADGLPDPDGRVKIVCQSGSPEQIEAFEAWARAQGLVDFYGDPARGLAGAYKLAAPSEAHA